MKYVITGGAGFIGSAMVRFLLKKTNNIVLNVDSLTYAGHQESLLEVSGSKRYLFRQLDLRDNKEVLEETLVEFSPDVIIHMAAESHVDRSLKNPAVFVETNIIGTFNLLESIKTLTHKKNGKQVLLVHVSTDEVFGELGVGGKFNEDTAYNPRSPYSASKASSDHLVRAWHNTYGIPAIITNCSNNYGPFQFPEKLIPSTIVKALSGEPLPVYGNGLQVRDWLYVDDHVRALHDVSISGKPGSTYLIGGESERTNLDIVKSICKSLEKKKKKTPGSLSCLISHTEDRAGHDFRYAVNTTKVKEELGWEPKESFETGLEKTIDWYLENRDWCVSVLGRD